MVRNNLSHRIARDHVQGRQKPQLRSPWWKLGPHRSENRTKIALPTRLVFGIHPTTLESAELSRLSPRTKNRSSGTVLSGMVSTGAVSPAISKIQWRGPSGRSSKYQGTTVANVPRASW